MKSTAILPEAFSLFTDTTSSPAFFNNPVTWPWIDAANVPAIRSDHDLKTIFESLLGQLFPSQGLLLLDETGQLLQSNAVAREFLRKLASGTTPSAQCERQIAKSLTLPAQVANLCEQLVDGRHVFPDYPLQLCEDIFPEHGPRLHLNAEWVELAEQPSPCILVRLEDVSKTAGRRALLDSVRYGLTPRETEVWGLYLQGMSYQEVSEALFISLCTVKKHMKNVHSKRRGELF